MVSARGVPDVALCSRFLPLRADIRGCAALAFPDLIHLSAARRLVADVTKAARNRSFDLPTGKKTNATRRQQGGYTSTS